jgi:hypothetical protein
VDSGIRFLSLHNARKRRILNTSRELKRRGSMPEMLKTRFEKLFLRLLVGAPLDGASGYHCSRVSLLGKKGGSHDLACRYRFAALY